MSKLAEIIPFPSSDSLEYRSRLSEADLAPRPLRLERIVPSETPRVVNSARDLPDEVRLSLAASENVKLDALSDLARDSDFRVRKLVATNVNTPNRLIELLANDVNPDVRQTARDRLAAG